jgi:CRISPR/Cas system-associated protein Cas10 (large subunit of type III CRISPR-Cas system)
MSEYLVLLDTDKIHRYVYSVGTLKSIRGASSILAELNEKKAVKKRVELHNGEYIFAGGGQVMAEFNSVTKAEEFIRAEKEEYENCDASITCIKDECTDGFKVKNAQIRLRRAKEERIGDTHLLSNPFFKTCQLCGINPASKLKYNDFVCTACERKTDKGEKIRKNPGESPIYAKFLEFVEEQHRDQKWKNAEFTKDLTKLGELSNPQNYLGLIYADGNRMGERLFDRTSKRDYQELSEAIENGMLESVFESLLKYIPNPYEGKPPSESVRLIPFEFVIMGGDDLIIITPAEKALPVALETLKRFEEKNVDIAKKIEVKAEDIEEKDKKEKFTLSAGVVIAHSKFPISSFTKLAEDLLTSAKKLNKEKWYGAENKSQREDISTIDYLVISSPSANPVEAIREKELTYKQGVNTYRLTQRPFTLEKADKIVNIVKGAIKSSKYLSRSRLYSLHDALHRGKNQSILNILSLVTRLKGEEQENIKKLFTELRNDTLLYPDGGALFPWNTGRAYDTPILDILELYDFIEEEKPR